MSEGLLVVIFVGATEGTTSTVLEHRRRHLLFGGQGARPYEIAVASSSLSPTGANFLPDGIAGRDHHAARSIRPRCTQLASLANT